MMMQGSDTLLVGSDDGVVAAWNIGEQVFQPLSRINCVDTPGSVLDTLVASVSVLSTLDIEHAQSDDGVVATMEHRRADLPTPLPNQLCVYILFYLLVHF